MAGKRTIERELRLNGGPFVYPPLPKASQPGAPKAAPTPPVKPAVDLPVPFIHQLWDVPEPFDGHWACGPTSMTMVLAYYQLLRRKPTPVSRPALHSSDLGWYICNTFSQNGKTLNKTAQSPSGPTPGIYGTALDNYGTPAEPNWVTGATGLSALARIFLSGQTMQVVVKPKIMNGSQETIFLQRKPFEAKVKAALDGGHPVIVSGRFFWKAPRFYDHILVIRGYYQDPGTGELKWLVNDPFGFKTDGSYSGGRVVYRFDEINPKWMCVFGGAAPGRGMASRSSVVGKGKPTAKETDPATPKAKVSQAKKAGG